ncbi:MAG: hypothetical protein U0931_39575 [Vulcanimicrobiota bacterium]
MASDELANFIEAGLGEGHFHSHGSFTLALNELVRKLGNHGLYHWANWSLFLVRGLVRLGCHSLHLNQKWQNLWLVGHGQEPQDLWEQMEALSAEQVLAGHSAAALIARALGSLVPEHVKEACLVLWCDGTMREILVVRGEGAIPKLAPSVQRQGWSIGLSVQLLTRVDLAQHLAYAVQYCPVPFLSHRTGWFDSDSEVRGQHWLDQAPPQAAYPPELMARVKIPLCCDVYQAEPEGGLLLKPCGGTIHAQRAFWSEQSNLDWLKPVESTGSISAIGRYLWGQSGDLQKLTFSGTSKYMNSSWGAKSPSTGSLHTCRGKYILLVAFEEEADQVVPILDGVALGTIRGRLGVPGVTFIVEAPDSGLDLSGLQLVDSAEFREWLRSLQRLLKNILEEVTEVPPKTSVILKQPHLAKVMAATGGACFLTGVAAFGFNPVEIFLFTHGAAFGGMAVATAMRTMHRHLPQSWQDEEREFVISTLKKRLRDTRRAIRQHSSERE